MADNDLSQSDRKRQERLSVLALSDEASLTAAFTMLGEDPPHQLVRGPETGLISLRGRIGGGGSAFNFGDCTVTRATVKLHDGSVGTSLILGRSREKARLIALIDALAQDPVRAGVIDKTITEPLTQQFEARETKRKEEVQATKVDFFTLVRGEDE
ncbi:MAG: phosphonate C-P lyase system protein PhnG [Pseudomonadota bacterium]